MTDHPTEYSAFLRELKDRYASMGFEVGNPRDFVAELGFEPDIVAQRGDEVVVVEIKSQNREREKSIRELRDSAEKAGYRFELMVMPLTPPTAERINDVARVPSLIRQARNLCAHSKDYDAALILAWIAIEISVRHAAQIVDPTSMLVNPNTISRLAVELDLIDETAASDLRAIANSRNQLVHGFVAQVDEALSSRAIETAMQIAKRANTSGSL